MTIKELRKQTGLSQSKFAKEFGLNLRTLQDWEMGRTNPPIYLLSLIERILQNEQVKNPIEPVNILYQDKNGIVFKVDNGILIKNLQGEVLFKGKPNFDYIADNWCLGTFVADLVKLKQGTDYEFKYNYDLSFWK